MEKSAIIGKIQHAQDLENLWKGTSRELLWKAVRLTYQEFLEE